MLHNESTAMLSKAVIAKRRVVEEKKDIIVAGYSLTADKGIQVLEMIKLCKRTFKNDDTPALIFHPDNSWHLNGKARSAFNKLCSKNEFSLVAIKATDAEKKKFREKEPTPKGRRFWRIVATSGRALLREKKIITNKQIQGSNDDKVEKEEKDEEDEEDEEEDDEEDGEKVPSKAKAKTKAKAKAKAKPNDDEDNDEDEEDHANAVVEEGGKGTAVKPTIKPAPESKKAAGAAAASDDVDEDENDAEEANNTESDNGSDRGDKDDDFEQSSSAKPKRSSPASRVTETEGEEGVSSSSELVGSELLGAYEIVVAKIDKVC